MASILLNKTNTNSSIPDHAKLLTAWKTNADDYLNGMPSIIKFVARRVTRKLSFISSLIDKINLIGNKDVDGIANLLNQEIALALITTSKNIVPKWISYIIPITIFLLCVYLVFVIQY